MNNCLKEVRLSKGYSQSELSKKSNVSRQTIIDIENGSLKCLL